MATSLSTLCSQVAAGYLRQTCELGAGGISGIWISQASGITCTFDAQDQITNISGGTFYKYDQVLESAELQADKITTNLANTSQFYETSVTMVIPKKSVAIRNQVKALASSGCKIITLDNNGIYHYHGNLNGCYCTEGGNNSGKAFGDANNWTLTFTAKEGQPSPIISGSAAFTSSY